jgi:hypothetical protein
MGQSYQKEEGEGRSKVISVENGMILSGDLRESLGKMKPESVQSVITSPP